MYTQQSLHLEMLLIKLFSSPLLFSRLFSVNRRVKKPNKNAHTYTSLPTSCIFEIANEFEKLPEAVFYPLMLDRVSLSLRLPVRRSATIAARDGAGA